ncbi:MAG: AAA family ATPase [Gammaproteobacteria bacterium]|nr:AAA family ATPase [Gammaproteobacteria bacterium]
MAPGRPPGGTGAAVALWETTKHGHGQAILLQGEAGIGKSRLIEALRAQIGSDRHQRVTFRCSAYHSNSALYPIIEHLKRAVGWNAEMGEEEKLRKLETALSGQSAPLSESVPLFADLLSLPLPEVRYPPVSLDPRKKREATLDAIAAWSLETAESVPVLIVWEDLHWADPSTLELLSLHPEQSPTVSMMNVLTYRAEFSPTWPMRSHMIPVTLNRLERPEVEAMIRHQASGKRIPPEVVEHIVAKGDGVPLYVEELTKAILESGFLRESSDRFELSGALSDISIPATLQDSLMARLDRLPTLREVAQMGAVLGREFAYEMLRAVVGLDEPRLQQGLEQLVADELLYQRGRLPRSRYIFKHALIQDAAYQSLLKRTRQQCHRRVAQLIEEQFRDIAAGHPELVAQHYLEGAEPRRAIEYWRKAGSRRGPNPPTLEAIAYFTRGLETLELLPDDDERARQELSLQLSLGHANIVAKGHGSVGAEQAYTRALALSERLGDTSELIPALFGLWRSFVVGRSLEEADGVAQKLRAIAKRRGEVEIEVVANYTSGFTALCMGRPAAARRQLEHSIGLYKPNRDSLSIYRAAQDPGVACRGYSAIAEWLLGYPDRARRLVRESIALAEEYQDRFSLAYVLCYTGAIVYEVCHDDTESLITRGLEVAAADGYDLWVAYGSAQRANLDLVGNPSDSALESLRAAIDAVLRLGVYLNTPYLMTCLARGYLRAGRFAEGLRVLDQARQSLEARGERWWESETHRLRGEVLLARSPATPEDAQACFLEALNVCRAQEAGDWSFAPR